MVAVLDSSALVWLVSVHFMPSPFPEFGVNLYPSIVRGTLWSRSPWVLRSVGLPAKANSHLFPSFLSSSMIGHALHSSEVPRECGARVG